MAKSKLPTESRETLAAEATIGPADIAKCQQMVRELSGPVKYLDGREVKTVRAEKIKPMWEAETE